jgi:hypothetical protein
VRDGVLRRTIDKWLSAGVLEGLQLSHPDAGTPQGGVVSPLLANIYLHEVVDQWFERDVKPRRRGRAFMVRFADDLVLVFSNERDARRVWDVLPKRFGKYGLSLHPPKTQLLPFRPCGPEKEPKDGIRRRGFDFLGFTHYWERSRRGLWVVKQKTASGRFGRALRAVSEWLKSHRHSPVAWQHRQLERKLRGHDAYYGITGNSLALARLRREVTRRWRYWLSRRSSKGRLNWTRFRRLLECYPLPEPVIFHRLGPRAANP